MVGDWNRTFIALVPDAAGCEALVAVPIGAPVRRVAVDQLHLTLAFLGSIPEKEGRCVAAALPSLVAPLPALTAGRVECWPSVASPRLVVAVFEPMQALTDLAARVCALVTGLGLPVDDHRPFRPHITLARLPRNARPVRADESLAEGAAGRLPRGWRCDAGERTLGRDTAGGLTLRFDSLVLYSSALERSGARYRALVSAQVPRTD